MKRFGYGFLKLKPDELFSLTPDEFGDMLDAYMLTAAVEHDRYVEALAWQTSLLMTATGNYGKKGVDMKKLYKRTYDEYGNVIQQSKGTVTPVDREFKEKELNKLIERFKGESLR